MHDVSDRKSLVIKDLHPEKEKPRRVSVTLGIPGPIDSREQLLGS